jgi:hypothetical protein
MENHKYEVQNYKTKKRVRVPKEDHIIVKNTHEQIISREDFDLVQKLIKSRYSEPKHNHENLFRGLVVCSQCGRRMSLAVKKHKNEKTEVIYKCMHHYKNKDECPKHNHIHYDNLKNIVTEKLRKMYGFINDDKALDIMQVRLNEVSNNSDSNKERSKIENRQLILNKITKKLYEDFALDLIDDITYHKLLDGYQNEQRSLNNRIKEINNSKYQIYDMIDGINKIKEILKEYSENETLTREILNKLIDKIIIAPLIIIT